MPLLSENSGKYWVFIDQEGISEAIRGHASKLDVWLHNMAPEMLRPLMQCNNMQIVAALLVPYNC